MRHSLAGGAVVAQLDDLADLKPRLSLSRYVESRVTLSPGKGDRSGLCPFHDEKTASFTVNDAKGFYHCFGCGAHGDILDWWQKADGLTFVEAVERLRHEAGAAVVKRPASERRGKDQDDPETLRKQAEARSIWDQAQPIAGTAGEVYLRQARCIAVALPECVRFHPGLRYHALELTLLPAMIAAVTDLSGTVVAIQRTFLKPDGSGKASIKAPKMGLGPVGRGAVRLGAAEPVIGVAEGIETGLSAVQLYRMPVWCALGSNLAKILLPSVVRYVAVFGDKGPAGEAAAEKARAAFHAHRRQVTVRFPTVGKDFNDELMARRRHEP